MSSLPSLFCERMKNLLGSEYENFFNEITSGNASKAFFANNGANPDREKYCCEKIPFGSALYYFDYDGIGKEPIHHAGGIYIQDPSAMAATAALGNRVFTNVLDMCASPGGKSLSASLLTDKKGVIVSNEYVPSRCKTLVGNFERFGIKNAIVTNLDMTEKNELHDIYNGFFDLIICDAPCSGEGMFRKYPEEAIGEWSVENVKLCAKRQSDILDNAVSLLCDTGILLYSTCTFSLDENEKQIDSFLSRHPEFQLLSASKDVQNATADGYLFDGCEHSDIVKCRRFYPHISRGEGQFIAVLQKNGGQVFEEKDKYKNPLLKPSKDEEKILGEFIKKNVDSFDMEKVFKYNENLVYINFDAKVPSKKVFSCGVKLGEVIKGRFEPHHMFFKCFGESFKSKIILKEGDERLTKYLHGDVLQADVQNGWCAVCYEGLILGGGKAVDGVVKNHYPKGLRNI